MKGLCRSLESAGPSQGVTCASKHVLNIHCLYPTGDDRRIDVQPPGRSSPASFDTALETGPGVTSCSAAPALGPPAPEQTPGCPFSAPVPPPSREYRHAATQTAASAAKESLVAHAPFGHRGHPASFSKHPECAPRAGVPECAGPPRATPDAPDRRRNPGRGLSEPAATEPTVRRSSTPRRDRYLEENSAVHRSATAAEATPPPGGIRRARVPAPGKCSTITGKLERGRNLHPVGEAIRSLPAF